MNRFEAIELLQLINDVYPQFELTQQKAATWVELLKDGHFQKSKEALLAYIKNKKFPPTIADFLVIENDITKKTIEFIEQMRAEIISNPPVLEETNLPVDLKEAILDYRKKKTAKQHAHLTDKQLTERKALLKKQSELLLEREKAYGGH
ncbi:hypothetical protein NNP57_001783 [Listeria monocytogenes]|uniref:replicative helicase loader/inhibitor n=1 Tax=Listeria monocytogenes TaxID=1639 RepID=UPI000E751B46|nr:replicative helicase loader/inhibitor [Listeria monocytogenes]EAE1343301.1 hypothetical protein [Listeria monocytogenes]EAF2356208.1 hypothetical protein [Listeria monocytogenes]EAG4633535.1 hypothetical protein [Listeria monocytogenes]EGH8246303.1 hypothetical protein [Listeria monocytogenes]EIZ3973000.1 hypothetical protein [Listeria monocytogenes]